jgi:hypothetical protein
MSTGMKYLDLDVLIMKFIIKALSSKITLFLSSWRLWYCVPWKVDKHLQEYKVSHSVRSQSEQLIQYKLGLLS